MIGKLYTQILAYLVLILFVSLIQVVFALFLRWWDRRH